MNKIKKIIIIYLVLTFILFQVKSQSINDNYINSIGLTVNGSFVSGTTLNNSIESGEYLSICSGTANQSLWYNFVATSTMMFMESYITGFNGAGTWSPARFSLNLFNSGGFSNVQYYTCQNINSQGNNDNIVSDIISPLIIGQVYYIQVVYKPNGTLTPNFNIRVSDIINQIGTCSLPNIPSCQFASNPSISSVINTCSGDSLFPYAEGSESVQGCFSLYVCTSNVDWNIIITSTCSGGNVSNFSWVLYNSNCTINQNGNLTDLQFNNLVSGNWYTCCFSYTVPSNCYELSVRPYYVSACILPIEDSQLDTLIESTYSDSLFYLNNLITYTSTKNKDSYLEVYNTIGQEIYFNKVKVNQGLNYYKVDLIPGFYILKLENELLKIVK